MAAAAIPLFVSVEEYLHSVYEPDLDYVDGLLEERNVGEFDHQAIQRAFLLTLSMLERQHRFYTALELRVQTAPSRYRVPDICLLRADALPRRIVSQPPMLCIEVLSPEDRFSRTREKCQDYLRMGVPEVWVIDPELRQAHVLTPDGVMREHGSGPLRLQGTEIEVDLQEIFKALDPQI